MRKLLFAGAFAVSALLSAAAPASAQGSSCFFINQWDGGWKAPDDHTVFIKVQGNRVYRLDLAGSCPAIMYGGSHLVTNSTSSSICSAIDWDLRVAQPGGPSVPCIVKNMTPLTHDEAAALPPNARP